MKTILDDNFSHFEPREPRVRVVSISSKFNSWQAASFVDDHYPLER